MKGVFRIALAVAAIVVCGSGAQAAYTMSLSSGSGLGAYTAILNLDNLATPATVQTGGTTTITSITSSGFSGPNDTSFDVTVQAFGYTFSARLAQNSGLLANPGILRVSRIETSRVGTFNNLPFNGPIGAAGTPSLDSFSVTVEKDGYTIPPGSSSFGGFYGAQFTSPGSNGANITYSASYLSGMTTTNLPSASSTGTSAAGSFTNANVTNSGSYTLTNTFNITGGFGTNDVIEDGLVGSSATQNAAVASAPAPAGLLLGLLGVPAFAVVRRFTRKSGATTETDAPAVA